MTVNQYCIFKQTLQHAEFFGYVLIFKIYLNFCKDSFQIYKFRWPCVIFSDNLVKGPPNFMKYSNRVVKTIYYHLTLWYSTIPALVTVAIWCCMTWLVVPDRLSNTKIKQTNSNTSSKQHSKVGYIWKLWLLVRFTKFNLPILGEEKIKHKSSPDVLRPNVQPRPSFRYPSIPFWKLFCCSLRLNQAIDDKTPDNDSRNECHYRVEFNFHSTKKFEADVAAFFSWFFISGVIHVVSKQRDWTLVNYKYFISRAYWMTYYLHCLALPQDSYMLRLTHCWSG